MWTNFSLWFVYKKFCWFYLYGLERLHSRDSRACNASIVDIVFGTRYDNRSLAAPK